MTNVLGEILALLAISVVAFYFFALIGFLFHKIASDKKQTIWEYAIRGLIAVILVKVLIAMFS